MIFSKHIFPLIIFSLVLILIQSTIIWYLDGIIPFTTGLLFLSAIILYIPYKVYQDYKSAKEYIGDAINVIKGTGDKKEFIEKSINKASELGVSDAIIERVKK